MRIIFYGTPEFAVTSLERIIENNFNVIAVVTAPDKPAGRGLNMQPSAVKQSAFKYNIPVLQPPNLKAPEFIDELKKLNPDIQVIIAFRMLPEMVWNLPPLGTLNLHGSLLPDYRGAAPINRAIMNGETKTGVSTFFLKHAIDTGNILMQREVEILDDDNAGSLHDKLMDTGADLVVESLRRIESGDNETFPQTVLPRHHKAPKIFTQDCEINWNQPVIQIHNQIRGLSPYPGAFTVYQNKMIKLFQGYYQLSPNTISGIFQLHEDKHFRISSPDGWYYPTLVQPEGKRKMTIQDFINGLK